MHEIKPEADVTDRTEIGKIRWHQLANPSLDWRDATGWTFHAYSACS
jgi:hypothetical protein